MFFLTYFMYCIFIFFFFNGVLGELRFLVQYTIVFEDTVVNAAQVASDEHIFKSKLTACVFR